MDNQEHEPLTVPLDGYAQAVVEQRNAALDEAAQWKAVALAWKAELDQARTELATFRSEPEAGDSYS